MPRRGAGRPRKRALESLATESPETSAGVEPAGQGQTSYGTAGASGSQTPMVSEVTTPTIPAVPTPTIFTVPPTVPLAYPAPPPPMPTAYQAPLSPVPTAYVAPAPAAVVAPHPVPPPTVPPAAPTYADLAVPPMAPASVYAAAPGMPPPAYITVPPVIPARVVLPVPAAIPTHLTDIVTAQHIASRVSGQGVQLSQTGTQQGGHKAQSSHRQQRTAPPAAIAFGMLEQEYPSALIVPQSFVPGPQYLTQGQYQP
ncbi:leucine-rich repeat extensin-like protein 3 [Zingiber officinale]|uniref:leucine-rich repeat extensin-like protein 3 n=1 Tax=Zingiber officinale TaxID=94328 RepID=UPI001C4A8F44|nr:leucine-rich repeat extensin-like protein 3 [Zingiber officinale]